VLSCRQRTPRELSFLVEKNDEDQKIEQDGIKPEDKAHKAATKIQASFRGHITRKKLKGEKKGEAQAAEADAGEQKEPAPAADAAAREGDGAAEAAPGAGPQAEEPGAAGDAASEEKKGEGGPGAAPAAEEKAASADTSSSSKADDGLKEEPKPARRALPPATAAARHLPRCRGRRRRPASHGASVDETKPKESARQDEGKEEEREADQEHA
uniref:Neuromodulin n=1 Tax=Cavia porcellus TaxID=10141 RepID=H0V870_CAVPO